MLESQACAPIKLGSPVVCVEALKQLQRFLKDLGFDERAPHPPVGEREVRREHPVSLPSADDAAAGRKADSQYALVAQARSLGFRDVVLIDEDQGRSAGGMVERPGF